MPVIHIRLSRTRSDTVMQAGGRNQKDDRLDRSNPVMMQRTENKEGGARKCMNFFAHAKHF